MDVTEIFEDPWKDKAPAESSGLRQIHKKKDNKSTFEDRPKKVIKETNVIFDEEGHTNDEVLELTKKKRGQTTPHQSAQSLRSSHSSPNLEVIKVTYYLFLSFSEFIYLQFLTLI